MGLNFFFLNWYFSLNKHSCQSHSILLIFSPFFPAFTFSQRSYPSPRICSATLCTLCSHLCISTDTNRTGILTLPPGGLAEWWSDHIWLKKSILGILFVVSSIFWGWRSTLYIATIFKKITCKGVPLLNFPADMKMPLWVTLLWMMDSREYIILNVCLCVRCHQGAFTHKCVSGMEVDFQDAFRTQATFFILAPGSSLETHSQPNLWMQPHHSK